jgi:hypothetical protein
VTGLFARLYLDEDVSARAAEMIAARGFNLLSTVQAGRLGTSDADQLSFASIQGRVLVTHNRRDFELLVQEYFAKGIRHAGLIIAVRRPPRDLTLRLLTALNQCTADEFVDQVFYL